MKLAVLFLLALGSTASAAPSRAALTGESWVKAMVDPKIAEPGWSLGKGKTLTYVVDSPEKACKNLAKGVIKSAAGLKSLKNCVVATRNRLPGGKGQTWKIMELKPVSIPEAAAKYLKTAPKDTAIIQSIFAEGPFSLEITVAVPPDLTVSAAWISFSEPDDTDMGE
jgi:hypothetical protein